MLKNNGFHNRHSPILRAFSPLSLFSGGAPGVWYDPSDLTTLFQDSAGTTPVTAVEQPVGRMLDKSGYGNHAFQATNASRPVLSARYNLLTKTELPTDTSIWQVYGIATVTAGIVDPDGGTAAAQIDMPLSNTGLKLIGPVKVVGTVYAPYIWVRADTAGTIRMFDGTGAGQWDGTLNVTTTWTRFTVPSTAATAANPVQFAIYRDNLGQLSKVYVAFPSLVPANQSTLPYQRVNTATDYATTGFLPYLKFDGVDDSLSTNSISFTSTDKMSVFAGVRKLSDAATGTIVELSVTASIGSFGLFAPFGGGLSNYSFRSQGTLASTNTVSGFVAPIANVLTGIGDISADVNTVRVNNVPTTITSDQGTGNYGNYPLYIGRRGGATSPFNGQMYSMIVVGKAVTAGELSSTETYVATKTGVTL